ncbi:complement C3-like [Dreissena polymorpha]|uniref:complement C3-like n=1 Tax=Dreissena polymorpha TaxID=45954 RepID=UPI00226461C9|nr:complement C3-like [Dreissena polymorpha]
MFHEPIGCGEQNMIRTAPIVYGMYFLKQTGTMEAKHEDSGTTKMRNGITRQISMYHKEDGSFTVWKSNPSSLWLTAFVAKVFCQAEHVVQGIAGRDVIQKTLSYIAQNNKEGSGDYRDDHPVYHREMQGVLAQGDRKLDPSLTAFVLTSLQECTDRTQEVEISVRRAMSALERVPNNIIQNNPYLLAISTYALALSNSSKKEEFKDKLYAIRRDIGGGMFWSNHNGAPNAYDVETTAYALLAFLKFDDFKTCHKIVAWLTQQNSAIGVWHTTQDTVVAMQALATYSARTYNPDTNLKVKIEKASAAWKKETIVNSETSQILIPALPVDKNDRKFDVTVSGRGSGVLKIEMFYNRKARDDELCPFDISPISVKDVVPAIANNPDAQVILAGRQCDVCGYCNDPVDPDYDDDVIMDRKKRQAIQGVLNQKCIQFTVRSKSASNDAGMSIVRVNLETGVRVVESDLIKMQNNKVLPRYEMPSDGQGFIILYLNSITSNPSNLTFRLEDHFSGNDSSRQPASVKVYDYYKPERSCMKQYGIGQNHGQEIKYKCDDGSDQCQCMQSQCIKQVNQELFDMALKVNQASPAQRKNLPKPVEALMDYACNFEKANYVVKVEVETVGYDSKREVKSAKAIIKEAPLQGKYYLLKKIIRAD